ncbi:MAG: M48 family metallopeptidase [Candidatus Omnitrophota bacterium]|nr:M48 family metallopeptidase [Candidatus Omnitrophota bacterium]
MGESDTPLNKANGSTPLSMALKRDSSLRSESSSSPERSEGRSRSAKKYSSLKYALAILDTACLLALLLIFTGFGISKVLVKQLLNITTNYYIIVPLYFLIISVVYYLLDLPLNLYSTYILEHRFCLSNQKIGDWLKDQIKGGVIFYVISIILIASFYYVLNNFKYSWWWVVSITWLFFSLILARLAPIVIIPLFFKYKKLSDDILRERIMNLANKMLVKILDVFEIDFSKKTLKANAAFVGIGNTRRVILADTLKDKYSDDEIEVILAHEFAHYKLKHLLKLILINSLATVLAFYFIFKTSGNVLNFFGLSSLLDIAALPVIIMYLVVFGIVMQPFQNYISRHLEKNADKMALSVTGLKEAFVSMMEKLNNQNLADRSPHPIIKFFFFDHPPVDERINMAKHSRDVFESNRKGVPITP